MSYKTKAKAKARPYYEDPIHKRAKSLNTMMNQQLRKGNVDRANVHKLELLKMKEKNLIADLDAVQQEIARIAVTQSS